MPYAIRKLPNQNKYSVKNKESGEVHSHHTSKAKAEKQVRLLEGAKNRIGVAKDYLKSKKEVASRPKRSRNPYGIQKL